VKKMESKAEIDLIGKKVEVETLKDDDQSGTIKSVGSCGITIELAQTRNDADEVFVPWHRIEFIWIIE